MIQTAVRVYRKMPRRLISALYIVAVLLFLYLYMKGTDFSQLKAVRIDWGLVVVASLWGLVFRYFMVVIWRVILRALGAEELPGFGIMAEVYAKAWISRYIPGTVTWIAGKIYMASRFGISKSRLAVSSLLEGGMQVVAAVIVSLLLIGFNPHIETIPLYVRIVTIVISCISLFVLIPPVFNRLLHFASVTIKKQKPGEELRINFSAVTKSFLLFVVGTFINGTAFYYVSTAITGHSSISLYFYVVGAFNLAGAIGMATPLLPSGVGVRDGIVLVLLGAVMSKDIALAITVFSRLWQVAVDAAFLGLTILYSRLAGEEISTKRI